jgi:hypothetical protein
MLVTTQIESSRRWSTFQRSLLCVGRAGWHARGSYFESCNCDAICPCRRIGGVAGGRSTHGVCLGALSWVIEDGRAGDVALDGLAVVLAFRYDDDEPGSPWNLFLYVDDRAGPDQHTALEDIFLGRSDGDIREHAPWIWKASRVLGVAPAAIEIDHTPRRQWLRVRDRVEVRVRAPVAEQSVVTCVIPGHDRAGEELTVEVLKVAEEEPLEFEYRGVCAYASTFDYTG